MAVITRAPVEAGSVRDIRPAARWFVAVLMPVGPLAVAVLRFVLPYDTTDSVTTTVTKIASHAGAERLVLWLTVLAVLTLVPGALAALRLASRGAPMLTAVAGLLLVPAYLSLFAVALVDEVGITATHASVGITTASQVATYVNQQPTSELLTVVFVAGHVVGSIVLAVALYRSRAVGRTGCLILGISQPIHLVAAISGNHPLDLIGWTLTAVGMAFAARSLLVVPIDDWSPRAQIG